MSAKPSKFVCLDCGRAYKAAETLNRHRKNHSANINYACDICDASFKRKDLLDRHCNIHAGGKQPTNHNRSQRACDRCSRLKTRCDNLVPCTRCTRGGHACTYKLKSSRARTDRSSRASIESNASIHSHDSPSYSIDTPAVSPEPSSLNDIRPQHEVGEGWMDSLWLEDPTWQWPQPNATLAPTQQIVVSQAHGVPISCYDVPPITSWDTNIDPSLMGDYLMPPLQYHDSDGYSASSASPSYSVVSMDSPLPTPNIAPQHSKPATLAPPKQNFGQNAAVVFPLWNLDTTVDGIL